MNIVITDKSTLTNNDLSFEQIDALGNVTYHSLLKPDEVAQAILEADAVLCNKTILSKEKLENAKNLKYIGLFATGYNNIDIDYCTKRGITVCNAGSYSTNAVAQHVFALILSFYSKVSQYNSFVQDGMWKKSPVFCPIVFPTSELCGKTLGIVGYGSIGRAVAKAAAAFNMRVLCFSRSGSADENAQAVDLDTLLAESDIVSAHCPLNNDSLEMFNKRAFDKMKDGALFINTSRGKVVNENDLLNALKSGKLSGAALDVLDTEPMAQDCVLFNAPNCIITPHVAWASVETRQRLVDIVADNLRSFINGKPKNQVN